jgi:DNA (cytosine-5)-methyltransferase 1
MKPRLLDLFCGAGGCSVGYSKAGFEVVGVDINPQPHYPFEFHQADALIYPLDSFDAYHASPPCQLWACGFNPNRSNYPDLIDNIRKRFIATAKPFVIENVPQSPVRKDLTICGCQVGLEHIRRKRCFEFNWQCPNELPKIHNHFAMSISVTGTGTPTGTWKAWGRALKLQEFRDAMGINWMARKELSEAIPPAYTEYIGKYLLQYIKESNNAPFKC